MKKIPIGVDNFSVLVDPKKDYLFVDKTLFIKELIERGAILSLIIRPRRWGKTLNMSMVQHFFAPEVNGRSTKGIFDNLNIANVQDGYYLKQYQGKYPVIFVSLKNVKEKSYQNFLNSMAFIVQNVCKNFPELTNSDKLIDIERNDFEKLKGINQNNKANEIELQNFLKTISGLLYKHYNKKVIILIDEYDTPLNAAYEQPHFEELVNFFKNMFGVALKGNDALEFGVMTGILRLSKNKMLSDLNNLKLYSLMESQYSQHFGFAEQEVLDLLTDSNVTIDIKNMRHWYNGYKSGSLEDIYNPWSILNCIDDKGKLKPYWIKTGDEALLKKVLLNSGEQVKQDLNELIVGNSIGSVIDEYLSFDQIKDGNDEVVWSLLWAMGYLKSIGEPLLSGSRYRHQLAVPNYEIECNYRDVFTSFARSFNESKYDALLKNLVNGNVDNFIKDLENFMMTIPSYHDLTNETNYHMLLLAWSFSLNETHDICSNKESGLGRPDLVLIPRDFKNDLGIILEFKKAEINKDSNFYQNLAEEGLQQIEDKQYDLVLKSRVHIKRILKLCLVFYGKQFVCKYDLFE
ncbi:MAG: AAA family ATPase [Gammaproteobacteria bacterium]|jgi:hypothetical protein